MRRIAVVNQKRCVACGACMNACPRKGITIWKGCYAIVDLSKCIGCGSCERTCPASCIEMIRGENDA